MMPLLELAALMGAIILAIRAVVRYRVARPNARDRWEPAALLGMANVASLFLVGLLIGGSAVLGKVVAGRYFVGDHGHYTEVPQWVWIYSWAHAVSQVGTVPFIFIWGFVRREAIEDDKGGGSTGFRGHGAA